MIRVFIRQVTTREIKCLCLHIKEQHGTTITLVTYPFQNGIQQQNDFFWGLIRNGDSFETIPDNIQK